ncbi:MAG: hypothetical protein EH225_05595 [Calditrichaeota bacterium]|nr:hypothetical protein [Calditrichota bacterium]RQW04656.1 MAG: hypothetical protein EH225_05595 [Calditrichota bacterium]
MKMPRCSYLIFITWFVLFFGCKTATIKPADYSGISLEQKEKILKKQNDKLNSYFSKKKWGEIYDMLAETHSKGLKKHDPGNRDTYIFEWKKVMVWPVKLNVRGIAGYVREDEAVTENIISMKLIFFPFKTYKRTIFHSWKFMEGQWYLLECDKELDEEDIKSLKAGLEIK